MENDFTLSDDEQYDDKSILPETLKLIEENIQYESQEFKDLINQGLTTAKSFLSKNQLEQDMNKLDKANKVFFKKSLTKYLKAFILKKNLMRPEFLKLRYGGMNVLAKERKQKNDNRKYGAPIFFEQKQIDNYLKLKVAPQLAENLVQFFDDPIQEFSNQLSPQKINKTNQFVLQVVENFKNQIQGFQQKIHNYGNFNELKKLREDTLMINSQVNGKTPSQIIVLKDAQKDYLFIEKLKKMVSQNSMLQLHIEQLEEDEDILNAKLEQYQSPSQSKPGSPDSVNSPYSNQRLKSPIGFYKANTLPKDIEMMFSRICSKANFNPKLRILRKLIPKNENEFVLSIKEFHLNNVWANIMHEILINETEFKFMVKKFVLCNNKMKSHDFNFVLQALIKQEGLESITYNQNELDQQSIDLLADFIQLKNLEYLSISSPVNAKFDTIKSLFSTLDQGYNIQRLDLVNIKYMNHPENFKLLFQNISEISELKHLNLSNNQLNPNDVAYLIEQLSSFDRLKLLSLNISQNNMKASTELVYQNKNDKIGQIEDSKATKIFYEKLNNLINLGYLQDLNLEAMNLGDKCLQLCESLSRNTSLQTVHLSFNFISEQAAEKFKWFLNIHTDFEEKEQEFSSQNVLGGSKTVSPNRNISPKYLSETRNNSQSALFTNILAIDELKENEEDNIHQEDENEQNDQKKEKMIQEKLKDIENRANKVYRMNNIYEINQIKQNLQKEISQDQMNVSMINKVKKDNNFNLYQNLEMNIINQTIKTDFKQMQINLNQIQKSQFSTVLAQKSELIGGSFILQRVLGHREFETLLKPLFLKEQIEKARLKIIEEDRQKQEIKQYGGILVAGKIISVEKYNAQQANKSESSDSLMFTDINEIGGGILMKLENLKVYEQLLQIQNNKYNQEPANRLWHIKEDCWLCNKYRYTLLFYQRSKANTWFHQSKDNKHINMIPKQTLLQYRKQIDILNTAISINKDFPLININFSILSPLLISNLCTSNSVEFKNPIEYVDKIIRKDVQQETNKLMVKKKEELFNKFQKPGKAEQEFQKYYMVQYGDLFQEQTKGVNWLKTIIKNLKYPVNSTFLNCIPFYNLSQDQISQTEKACENNDLFISTQFIKPGPQTVIILDNYFDSQKGKFKEVIYFKEFMIEQMNEDLIKLGEDDYNDISKYLQEKVIENFDEINAYLLKEQEKIKMEELQKRREELFGKLQQAN